MVKYCKSVAIKKSNVNYGEGEKILPYTNLFECDNVLTQLILQN